jgi:cell division septation protein DedD
MSDQDTEITLGTGKLLGLFFALVIVCGLFLGLGFMLGKSSSPASNASLVPDATAGPTSANAAKPSSARGEAKPQQGDCPQGQNCTPTPEMSFYKSDDPKSDAKDTPGPLVQSASAPSPEAKTVAETKGAPEITKQLIPGTGYIVQIAAVSKQQDAEALVGALKKKAYPVFISNPPGDALYHVQIGPFADAKEAEAMRTKLQGDGYNPILKR